MCEDVAAMLAHLFKRVTVFLAVLIGGICLLLLACQRSLIYFPTSYTEAELAEVARAGRQVAYTTDEGEQVAFYLPPPGGDEVPERIWLVTSGNAALAADWLPFARRFSEPGAAFLLVDYPGYGLNEGKPDPSSIRASSRAAVEALAADLGLPADQIGGRVAVLGHSVGAAAALMLANDVGASRAVLVAPFTSMTAMARRTVGAPLCYLLLHRFDNRQELAEMVARGGQVTVIHGARDDIIPTDMGRELAGDSAEFIEIPNAGHNDIITVAEDTIHAAMRP